MKHPWNAHPLLSRKDWLHEHYVTLDKSASQIAKELGVWRNTVENWVRRHKIPPRRRGYSELHHGRVGRYKSKDGYVYVYAPEHPQNRRANGRSRGVREHRLVMERHLGRRLERHEVVHHKNGKRDDNRIENLQLMSSNSAHRSEHTISESPLRALLRDKSWLETQLNAGRSFSEIAAMAGCKSEVAVFRWARKFGLKSKRKNQYA
jgi:transposase-like protein